MQISILLEKYKSFTHSQETIKKIIIETCEENNLTLTKDEILVVGPEIKIKTSGAKKVETILLKNKINSQLEKQFLEKGFKVKQIV